MPRVSVATLNLKKGELEWGLRAPWLLEQLARLRPDVIGFQEVDLRLDQGNWIRRRLNDLLHGAEPYRAPYVIHHVANPRENVAVEALALMTHLPVRAHEGFDYLFRNRVAHRIRVDLGEATLDVYNTHFHDPVGEEHNAVRERQAEQLRDWIDARSGVTPVVLMGDFNAPPGTRPLRVLAERMRPAYEVRHGAAPPTTLSPLFWRSEGVQLELAVDHIFVGDGVGVVEASLAFEEPGRGDPPLYASDHFGLAATLEIARPRERLHENARIR